MKQLEAAAQIALQIILGMGAQVERGCPILAESSACGVNRRSERMFNGALAVI